MIGLISGAKLQTDMPKKTNTQWVAINGDKNRLLFTGVGLRHRELGDLLSQVTDC